jgi:hypothetical protein
MKTLSIALMAAFMLVLASTSTGQAQRAAEAIYNDPSPGGRYVYRGCNLAQVIFIRGDKLSEINELTLIIEVQGGQNSHTTRLTFPILAKHQEGNKLILDYQWPPAGDTYEATIIGGTLINRKTKGYLAGIREEMFTRE